MRFEHLAAYGMGVFLPVAEVFRRRTDFSDIPAYVDDFIWGGLLLISARSVSKRRPAGGVLLVVAWAVLSAAMYYSFFGQIRQAGPADVSGLSNGLVIGIKGAIGAVAVVALALSARAAIPDGRGA